MTTTPGPVSPTSLAYPTSPVLIHDGFPPDLFNFSSVASTGGIGGSSSDRTPGVHLSGITYALALQFGYQTERVMSDYLRQSFMGMGNAVEWALAYAYSRRHPGRYIHQPPEMILDGILAHVDLIDVADPRGLVVDDVKCKWRQTAKDSSEISSAPYWEAWTRVKGYCHYFGSHIGRLHVFNVNGEGFGRRADGSAKSFGPTYRVWEWEWTPLEIEQNWQMILNHRHLAKVED